MDVHWFFRIAEAFKWAFGARTEMGDPFDEEITQFVNEVHLANIGSIYADTN